MKKTVAVLVLLFALSLFAQAEESRSSPFTYTLSEDGATIARYTGDAADVTITQSLDGHPVVAIGKNAFSDCSQLTSVSIPEGVTSIGPSAFGACENLSEAILPGSLSIIDDYAFRECPRLQSIVLSGSLKSIGAYAFYRSGLVSIEIPDGVTEIDPNAFRSCGNLMSVTLPDSVASIGFMAFAECDLLCIRGSKGSYAEKYCEEARVTFLLLSGAA